MRHTRLARARLARLAAVRGLAATGVAVARLSAVRLLRPRRARNRLRAAGQRLLERGNHRRRRGGTGEQQRGEEAEDQTDAGVHAVRAPDERPEPGPNRSDGQGDAPLVELQPEELAIRLGQELRADDETGADDAGEEHGGQHREESGVPAVVALAAVIAGVDLAEVEEREDEEQDRCSDHCCIASGERAVVHVRSFVVLVVMVWSDTGRPHRTDGDPAGPRGWAYCFARDTLVMSP